MIPVSAILGYLYCPRKTWLSYVAKEKPETEFKPTILGSIRHNAMDKSAKYENEILTKVKEGFTKEDIEMTYRQYYMKAVNLSVIEKKNEIEKSGITMQEALNSVSEQMSSEAKIRAKYIFEFITSEKVYGEELASKMVPRINSEVYVDSYKLGLHGFIDKIEKHNEIMIPFEIKTGKAPKEGVWESHRIQIAAYIMMLNEKFKQNVREGYVDYVNDGIKRKVIINEFLEDEIKGLINETNFLLKSEKIPRITDNENKCNNCNLFKNCRSEKYN